MTHYDELGVSRDATPEAIKKAYYAKAHEIHPDKGGDASAFAKVAKAYEVLSDSERRLLYDATGQDKRQPLEVEVQNILMQGFNEALAQEDDIEIVAFVRGALEKVKSELPAQVEKLKTRRTKLTAKRSKIKSKGRNVVHLIIDGELQNIAGQLMNIEHQLKVTKACLKTLKGYSEDWTPPPREMFTTMDLRRMQFGTGTTMRW